MIFNYMQAPMKLVLQSERMYFAEPRMKKRLRVLMKLEVSSDLIPSMGLALVFMQVNITAHRFAVGRVTSCSTWGDIPGTQYVQHNIGKWVGLRTEAICWQIGHLWYFSRAT